MERSKTTGDGDKVVSIVERIEMRQIEHLREQSSKLRVREFEAAVEWLEFRKWLERTDLDEQIAQFDASDDEGLEALAHLRCARGLRSCLAGDVAGGHAEWSEVVVQSPKSAMPHLARARWLMDSDAAAAVEHYDRAAEVEPDNPAVYWRRGNCHQKLGDLVRANANYRRAAALDPTNMDGLYAMAKALEADGEIAEATRAYDRVVAVAPRYIDVYMGRAGCHEVLENYEAAIRDYDRVVGMRPTHTVARFRRAKCRAHVGDRERAIEELTELAAANAEQHLLFQELGEQQFAAGEWARAVETLSRAIELAPGEHAGWGYRALAYLKLDDDDRATADIVRAMEIAPVRTDYMMAHVIVRDRLLSPEEKIANLAGPIEEHPNTHVFLEHRAGLYAQQKEYALALADFDRVIAMDPTEVRFSIGRAQALAGCDRVAEAIEETSRALDLEPDHATALAMRGAYRNHLDGDEALIAADFDRAAQIAPTDATVRYHRGCFRMAKQQYEAAVEDFDVVLSIAKDSGKAYFERAYCRSHIDEAHFDDEDWEEDEDVYVARFTACLADAERALELGYCDEDVFLELYGAHSALNDDDAALRSLERGLEVLPKSACLYLVRASFRTNAGDAEGAAADNARADEIQAAAAKAEGASLTDAPPA